MVRLWKKPRRAPKASASFNPETIFQLQNFADRFGAHRARYAIWKIILDLGPPSRPDEETVYAQLTGGMPDTSSWVHPIYFANCLTKAVNMDYDRKMDHPSNGLSIVGYLRPTFADEESYLRRQFHSEDSDGDNSDWQDLTVNLNSNKDNEKSPVSLQDFQDAEPDILVHSTSAIIDK
ncbi:hypothetical protein WN944_000615 [Citrus x changshan-huyou]|uniref:Uncharacterized protein n=1 Tax=Citrus x changshan-huyou TaxID=2935761 RepID=A0AAP0MI79_9ROSI